ncbi:hypothetical protein BK703_16825 [Bacillus thuringiensis serovar silo]|nr:hypothetical protein BK703_16825 [Bacillus thuringiensis serovar silo]OTW74266.1 hypothetical protein BK700_01220 [Bacillus thuringiensis serovar toguchini]
MLPISFAGGILFGTVFAGLAGIMVGALWAYKLSRQDSSVSSTMTKSYEDRRYMSKGLQNYYEGR